MVSAASLTDALNELKTSLENEHPEISLIYNFGSSGKLAQQIEQGAPSDIFLSASKKDMDNLQEKNSLKTIPIPILQKMKSHTEEAKVFLEYLTGEKGKAILKVWFSLERTGS
ncbi:molybdate ABC transporter substrate-binding protein [Aneurinibacillus terranovensis]|uniref:molybdate ABC transporter substrate-binding protein n=1 Tax=Aneurinibacillus terranovensis TaxID=278991 RepID=UPI001FDF2AF5|nr:molybdate ABC transporter substrate-binding protein [Aneurinibacillus terranovensis]